MGRLIDVDALKVDYGMAEDCKDCKTGYRSCDFDRNYSKMDFCGWLDEAPTVDAVPVRHGHWVYTPTSPFGFTCSECGIEMCRFNYCPNCGADMRKDGEGNENH